jgi:hypothetical protein
MGEHLPQRVLNNIEAQASLRSSDSTPRPSPSPLSSVSKYSLFLSLPECRRFELTDVRGEGEGMDEEPSHTTARKPVPLNHSILSDIPGTVHWETKE